MDEYSKQCLQELGRFGDSITVDVLTDASYEELTSKARPWCRYCGARVSCRWYSCEWGKDTLCNAHGQRTGFITTDHFKQYERPKAPVNPFDNSEGSFLKARLSHTKNVMTTDNDHNLKKRNRWLKIGRISRVAEGRHTTTSNVANFVKHMLPPLKQDYMSDDEDEDFTWRESLIIGSKLNVLDPNDDWYVGRVKQIEKKNQKLLISYNCWDEWIDRFSDRLQAIDFDEDSDDDDDGVDDDVDQHGWSGDRTVNGIASRSSMRLRNSGSPKVIGESLDNIKMPPTKPPNKKNIRIPPNKPQILPPVKIEIDEIDLQTNRERHEDSRRKRCPTLSDGFLIASKIDGLENVSAPVTPLQTPSLSSLMNVNDDNASLPDRGEMYAFRREIRMMRSQIQSLRTSGKRSNDRIKLLESKSKRRKIIIKSLIKAQAETLSLLKHEFRDSDSEDGY